MKPIPPTSRATIPPARPDNYAPADPLVAHVQRNLRAPAVETDPLYLAMVDDGVLAMPNHAPARATNHRAWLVWLALCAVFAGLLAWAVRS